MHKSESAKRIARKKAERVFSSNAIRLSFRELIISTMIVILLLFVAMPWVWQKKQQANIITRDFRLAEKYRDNYWLYEQIVEASCQKYPLLFLGDSVVWGMYVDNHNTIPAILNRELGRDLIGNIAIDGLHSVAMEELINSYGSAIRNKKVILHYNPLWMNSPGYDLSIKSDFEPHHPRLLPQFSNEIACERGKFSKRCSILFERNVPFYGWLNHIRLSFFDNQNFKDWMVNNYDSNPLTKISMSVDACEQHKTNSSLNWKQQGITKQDWDWVDLSQSRQFQAFLRLTQTLQQQDNELCIMVGPINPHMLNEDTLAKWRVLQEKISKHFESKGIECIVAKDLPSEHYADASHPLAPGYELLARQLAQSQVVRLAVASQ